VSPEIYDDNEVTFRFHAPYAEEVILTGDFFKTRNAVPMKKYGNGLWEITVGPLTPDVYSYSFRIEGAKVLDQDNGWIKPGVSSTDNMFLVPGKEAEFLQESDVPHGDVRMVYYQSKGTDKARRMHIYFPPGYDETRQQYPVVYLLHGGGDNDNGWISIGRANFIMDNLIAQGQSKPMIVVMPSIWVLDPPVSADRRQENNDAFAKSLVEDIIPFVEEHYRTLSGPENRAIGGLSYPNILPDILFANIDKFNYAGFTSNGLTSERLEYYIVKWPGRIADKKNSGRIKIWIGDGTNAFTYSSSRYLADAMPEYGYKTTFYETEGIHGWPWFRRYFAEWSTHLFK